MDARTFLAFVCPCALLAATGCTMPNGSPGARPAPGETPAEQSEVVSSEELATGSASTEPAADLEHVRQWAERIERVDDLRTQIDAQSSSRQLPTEIEQQPEPVEIAYAAHRVVADDPNSNLVGAANGDAQSERGSADSEESGESAGGSQAPPSNPPVLGSVSASAAGFPHLATPARETTKSPLVNTPEAATGAPLNLETAVEDWLSRPSDGGFRDQIDRRLLAVLIGRDDIAAEPLECVSYEQQELAGRAIEFLAAVRESHGGAPEEEANRILLQLEALQQVLIPASELQIPALVICRSVRGFGQYEMLESPTFPAGRTSEFVLYAEVANFNSRANDSDGYSSEFSLRTTVLNRAGDVVLDLRDDNIVDNCRSRRHDCFIPRLVSLPATLSPGQYVAKATVVDRIGNKVAERRAAFHIEAR